jgi:5'-3' exonuclease
VDPQHIPDFLALVGDAADGYPGLAGIGRVSAARLIGKYGALESFPPEVLGERRDLALLFKKLATLKTDVALFADADSLRWRGPTGRFEAWAERFSSPRLLGRSQRAAAGLERD